MDENIKKLFKMIDDFTVQEYAQVASFADKLMECIEKNDFERIYDYIFGALQGVAIVKSVEDAKALLKVMIEDKIGKKQLEKLKENKTVD